MTQTSVTQQTFSNSTETWININFTWSDVQILEELDTVAHKKGVRGLFNYYKYDLEEKKKKRIIKLVAQVKNFKKTNQKKEIHDNITVTVKDLKTLLKEYNKIKIFIKINDRI